MTKVNLEITTYWAREPDPEDRWDSGDRDGYIERVYISKGGYDYSYRGCETELQQPFWVVYADYSTGSTFGQDYDATIVGIVETEEEADELASEARNFEGFGSLSNGFYVPWNGYFERLRGVYTTQL